MGHSPTKHRLSCFEDTCTKHEESQPVVEFKTYLTTLMAKRVMTSLMKANAVGRLIPVQAAKASLGECLVLITKGQLRIY